MKRRALIMLLSWTAAWPPFVLAQALRRRPVIGYLVLSDPEPVLSLVKEGLRRLGYIDGKTIHIEFRSAEGKAERLGELAAELVRMKVDLLVASQTPAVTAAKNATNHIPIVMAGAGDPVGTGLVTSLARPGGNITGTSGTTADLGGKLLELIRELMPSVKRVAVLANATDPFTKRFLEQLEGAAPATGLELSPIMIRDGGQFSSVFPDLVKRRTDVVIVQPSLQRRVAADMAVRHRIPAVSPAAQFPAEGGLMSYAASLPELHRETAVFVDKILRGAKPADLPVQLASTFELVINLKTAKAIGVTIPRNMLLRADKLIE